MGDDPHDVAVEGIRATAKALGIEGVDPVLTARLAGMVVGLLLRDPWAEAAKAGAAKAAEVTTLAEADRLGRER